MLSFLHRVAAVLIILLGLGGCGYHHPAAVSGRTPMPIHHGLWENRTSEFGLEGVVDQELTAWLRKAPFIKVLEDAGQAEYLLDGAILSIQRTAASYDAGDQAREIRFTLTVSFTLRRRGTETPLWEVRDYQISKVYGVGADAIRTRDYKQVMLDRIVTDLAEDIYLRILDTYRKQTLTDSGNSRNP